MQAVASFSTEHAQYFLSASFQPSSEEMDGIGAGSILELFEETVSIENVLNKLFHKKPLQKLRKHFTDYSVCTRKQRQKSNGLCTR